MIKRVSLLRRERRELLVKACLHQQEDIQITGKRLFRYEAALDKGTLQFPRHSCKREQCLQSTSERLPTRSRDAKPGHNFFERGWVYSWWQIASRQQGR